MALDPDREAAIEQLIELVREGRLPPPEECQRLRLAANLPLRAVAKGTMPRELLSRRRHTHHALDDAIEQAELFANLMAWPGRGGESR